MCVKSRQIKALIVAATSALTITGCGTSGRPAPRYAWSTAQEPEYTAVFRSRWWSFYDRGVWSQLRGDYAAAEQDLLTAYHMRQKEQLWPRTYGMHFIPEYFPKRELGVTLYQLGRYDEATTFLVESLDEQYSARASYYLDLTRAAILTASGTDVEAPHFELISPDPAAPTNAVYAEFFGIATDDQYVSKVFVNGAPVDLKRSSGRVEIRHPIVLSGSENEIETKVVDLLGKSTVQHFKIRADHEGPVVGFDKFDSTRKILGVVVHDDSGLKSFSIGNDVIDVPSSAGRDFRFDYRINHEIGSPELTYRCVDMCGNVTEGAITGNVIEVASGGAPRERVMVASLNPDIVPAALDSGGGRFAAELVNLEEGQRFYQDTISVDIEVISATPIREVHFNGEAISIAPGLRFLRLSRTIILGDAPTTKTCQVEAINDKSEMVSEQRTINRELSDVDTDEWRLSLSFVETLNNHPRMSREDVETSILTELQKKRSFEKRFGSPVVRDKEALDRMLQEHRLAVLGHSDFERLSIDLLTADVFIETEVSGTNDFLQIILQGYSTTVNRIITNRVEVAGSFDDLPILVDTLATRLVQEFPRLRRPAIDIRGSDVAFTMTATDGIREYYNCVFVESTLGEARGKFKPEAILKPLAQGHVTKVRNKEYSEAVFEGMEDAFRNLQLNPGVGSLFVMTK